MDFGIANVVAITVLVFVIGEENGGWRDHYQIRDITQSEFTSAGMVGLKPAKKFRVRSWEYCGERLIEYDGVIYSIYRSYLAPDGRIELYTEERTGENYD